MIDVIDATSCMKKRTLMMIDQNAEMESKTNKEYAHLIKKPGKYKTILVETHTK